MGDLTLTELRKTLFQVADQVLATGAPVSIRRRGRTLTLSADARSGSGRLSRLKRRRLIRGDASKLWKLKVGKWRGGANLG